jgi:hypothetical protein
LVLLAHPPDCVSSEMFGLKWRDIDFDLKAINRHAIRRLRRRGPSKTESSQKPVPAHERALAAALE